MTRKQARRSQSSTDGSIAAPSTQSPADSASDSITQFDRLSELIDQEVKKPKPSHPVTSSAERTDEEALQAYLNQFMERMTGKKAETRPELALTSAWPANKPVVETVQPPGQTAAPGG